MKVRIESSRCHGHQMCAISAPAVFGSDEYGNGKVLTEDGAVPPAHEAAVRRAVGNCPEQAVVVVEA